MTNDLTTVEGVLQQAIDDLETNLQSMGVIDAEFNPVTGILGLISRITEIEPAVAGLDLDTNITCLCESPGSVGVPLNITGILSASYDDTTVTDVDLSGVLQNATVKIYNGNTLLGTAVTDNNGRYTFEYTPLATGVLSIIAIFEGTENYDNCQSSNITVDIHSLTLSSSADIVSAGDTVTLTATHLDESNIPIENETITFEIKDNSDEVIDTLTAVTDSSGIATVSYLVQGSESLYIQAKGGIILSEICRLFIYFLFYGDKSLPNNIEENWDNINNLPITYSGQFMVLNGTGVLVLPIPIQKNMEIEYVIKHHSTSSNSGELRLYGSYDENTVSSQVFRTFWWNNYIGIESSGGGYWGNYYQSSVSEHRMKIRIQDSTITVWHNNSQIASKSNNTLPDKVYVAFVSEMIEYIKEIRITQL